MANEQLTKGDFGRLWDGATITDPEPLQVGRRQTYADGMRVGQAAAAELSAKHAAELAELQAIVQRQTEWIEKLDGDRERQRAAIRARDERIASLEAALEQQRALVRDLNARLATDWATEAARLQGVVNARARQETVIRPAAATCTPSRQNAATGGYDPGYDAGDLRGFAGAFS